MEEYFAIYIFRGIQNSYLLSLPIFLYFILFLSIPAVDKTSNGKYHTTSSKQKLEIYPRANLGNDHGSLICQGPSTTSTSCHDLSQQGMGIKGNDFPRFLLPKAVTVNSNLESSCFISHLTHCCHF